MVIEYYTKYSEEEYNQNMQKLQEEAGKIRKELEEEINKILKLPKITHKQYKKLNQDMQKSFSITSEIAEQVGMNEYEYYYIRNDIEDQKEQDRIDQLSEITDSEYQNLKPEHQRLFDPIITEKYLGMNNIDYVHAKTAVREQREQLDRQRQKTEQDLIILKTIITIDEYNKLNQEGQEFFRGIKNSQTELSKNRAGDNYFPLYGNPEINIKKYEELSALHKTYYIGNDKKRSQLAREQDYFPYYILNN